MSQPVSSPWLAPADVLASSLPTAPPADAPTRKELKGMLADRVDALADLQRKLYADDRFSVLLVFQALDAAGKDGTIRKVLSGVNPAGCQVHSFKSPSKEELDHDFLWRTSRALPERGRIGVFNRSYYEEVLVVRVHPGYLGGQRLPRGLKDVGADEFWAERMQSIAEHERHIARNGTVVIKFFLNVSRDEQARRLLARIEDPKKNWKFNAGDVEEREHWTAYQSAFREAISATHRPWAPWYCIPADDKAFMRYTVADIVVRTLQDLPLRWPELGPDEEAELQTHAALLKAQLGTSG
ncbi:MAG: polyphosphate kinase 2 family protein [Deltaproteobacteria bacterium]|nr:polyphosphate kinase 2 family protein [Deltaproteobacteria bacterium]